MKNILRAFYFKSENLKQLKIACAENDVKMSHVMCALLDDFLKNPTHFKRICDSIKK